MPEISAPPKWILHLLWFFKGESCYPQIVGDLSEEFQCRTSEYGIEDARRWYRREVSRNFISLAFRWTTIAAVGVPLICVALFIRPATNPFMYFSASFARWLPIQDSMTKDLTLVILVTGLKGLAFGMICGVLLRGHERITRLVFSAFYLGFWVIWGINHSDVLAAFKLTDPATSMPLLGFVKLPFFIEPVWILAFIWLGSTWVERRHRRQNTGSHLIA